MIARTLLHVAALVLVYVVVLGSAEPGDLAVGAALALGLVMLYRRHLWGEGRPSELRAARRLLAFPPFLGAALAQVVKGTADTALVVLGLKDVTPGIVRLPVGDRSPKGAAVTSLVLTLSPGAVLIDSDSDGGQMLFHLLDAADPDAFRAEQQRFYDTYQKKVFP